jgi:hypothetical protein
VEGAKNSALADDDDDENEESRHFSSELPYAPVILVQSITALHLTAKMRHKRRQWRNRIPLTDIPPQF